MFFDHTLQESILNWQRFFHRHPETSFQEFGTIRKIREVLEALGIESKLVGETGLVADFLGTGKGESAKCLLLRADIDALPIQEHSGLPWESGTPGVAHLCGHDGHTAALLGAVTWLHHNRASFSGKVRAVFQQAEELAIGAPLFVQQGWLEGVDSVAALHFWPYLESGKMSCEFGPAMAGVERFIIQIAGQSAHISTPHKGLNAMIPAAEVLLALQSCLTQEFSPFDDILVGIGKLTSGTQYNVIPYEATLEGTTRFFDESLRIKARDAIQRVVEHVPAAHNTTGTVDFSTYMPAAMNDDRYIELAVRSAVSFLGEDNVLTKIPRQFAGDDFTWFQQTKPGIYVKVGIHNPANPQTGNPLHHPAFMLDDQAILTAAEFLARYTINFFEDDQTPY